jgi:hypothetical protein
MNHLTCTATTPLTPTLTETGEVRIQKGTDQVLGPDNLQRTDQNGPGKGSQSSGMANSNDKKGNTTICQICQLLPSIHPRLFRSRMTTIRPYREG